MSLAVHREVLHRYANREHGEAVLLALMGALGIGPGRIVR